MKITLKPRMKTANSKRDFLKKENINRNKNPAANANYPWNASLIAGLLSLLTTPESINKGQRNMMPLHITSA